MDKLDENLLELKRRVDARVEQMLIDRRAQATEKQALVTNDEGSSGMLETRADLDLAAHTRPALLLPKTDDPTVVRSEKKMVRPLPNPISASSQLQKADTDAKATERVAEHSLIKEFNASSEHDRIPLVSSEIIVARPPAIIRQGFLRRVLGKLLARKS